MAQIIKAKGYVLNTLPFKESSLFASILAHNHGKIRILAKGCRRPKSKMCGALERFNLAEFIYYKRETKEVYTLSDATVIDDYPVIRAHPVRVHAALVLCEFYDKTLPPENEENNAFALLAEFLNAIKKTADRNLKPLVLYYLLKSLPDAGVRPHLDSCVRCHRAIVYQDRKVDFSVSAGGTVCERDFDDTVITIPESTLEMLRDLFSNHQVALDTASFQNIERLVKEYLSYHLNGLTLNSLRQFR